VRVFLDTNVLVSAYATRGLCADVLREVLASHRLVISDPLLVELNRVLRNKLGIPTELAKEVADQLRRDGLPSRPGALPEAPIQDRKDLAVLSCALEGHSDLLVTGDKELLDLGRVETLEIVSPRAFWERVRRRRRRRS